LDVGFLPLSSVYFDEDGLPAPPDANHPDDPAPPLPDRWRLPIYVDLGLAGGLALLCIILLSIGWGRLISATYEGVQGNTMADICVIISVTILLATLLRCLVNRKLPRSAGLSVFRR
jgi:hypothetical protein